MNTWYKDGLPELGIQIILKSLISAVSYLHDNKMIHNDIKSDNIIITHDGQIKLVDGLTRLDYAN
jgi:serine/threonine protein kinase